MRTHEGERIMDTTQSTQSRLNIAATGSQSDLNPLRIWQRGGNQYVNGREFLLDIVHVLWEEQPAFQAAEHDLHEAFETLAMSNPDVAHDAEEMSLSLRCDAMAFATRLAYAMGTMATDSPEDFDTWVIRAMKFANLTPGPAIFNYAVHPIACAGEVK